MTEKYFLGYENVSYDRYLAAKDEALAEGNGIKEEIDVGGHKNYVLMNGLVIQGDNEGNFNEIKDSRPAGKWQVGTVDDYAQGEATGGGKAEFFFKL